MAMSKQEWKLLLRFMYWALHRLNQLTNAHGHPDGGTTLEYQISEIFEELHPDRLDTRDL